MSDVSRAPPFGHGDVEPPHTHAPPPETHVSSSVEPLLDDSPELLEVACVLPDDDVDDVAPPSFAPVLSSELHACVMSNAAVEKNERKRSPRFMEPLVAQATAGHHPGR